MKSSRWKNKVACFGIELLGCWYELELTHQGYFMPGRYSGAPEDCYPDEGDIEIERIVYATRDGNAMSQAECNDLLELHHEEITAELERHI